MANVISDYVRHLRLAEETIAELKGNTDLTSLTKLKRAYEQRRDAKFRLKTMAEKNRLMKGE